ncbi:MAG TPA: GDP-mannose 4,6-dehydratase [Polyangiaceae bacterium]|nr:GDP-mannose 4,6-dehydratase [Polyangiaceae bacterium]
MARVLVTGVAGQVGSYLAESLSAEGHAVVGLGSRADAPLPAGVERARGSLDPSDLPTLLGENGPLAAVVHLASVTSMVQSWEEPMRTFDLNGRAGVALAYAVARVPGLRLVHASSAEIFGRAPSPVQDESTPIAPVSPYGIAKAAAHLAVRLARETHGTAASNLILYLAESPRRRPNFVLRKIVRSAAAVAAGKAEHIVLGNGDAVRDFCHARDVAEAAKTLALGARAGDYVCASGRGHSIAEVARLACRIAGLDPDASIRFDASLRRPNDLPSLIGDSRCLQSLGWSPRTSFEDLLLELFACDAGQARE